MRSANPNFSHRVAAMFSEAPFVAGMGIRLVSVEIGCCEASLALSSEHLQHLGRVHGGVITTLAGHGAAGAATSLIAEDRFVVAAEFSMNLLRAAEGGVLRCRSKVLKPGSTLIVTETEVWGDRQDRYHRPPGARLVAKATHTFMVMADRP